MPTLRLPATVYAVGLLYFHKHRDEHCLLVRTFTVSGLDPLTQAEAVARARTLTEAEWTDAVGRAPATQWDLSTAAVVPVTLGGE